MSYYNNYYPYTQPSYNSYSGYNSYSSPAVAPVSGLTMMEKYNRASKKKSGLLAAIIILALLLIAAIIVVIVLYFDKSQGQNTAEVGSMTVKLIATRTDQVFSSEFADETQNAYQSLASTTCYSITTAAANSNYVITDCKVNSMSAGSPSGIDIDVQLDVFLGTEPADTVLSGLSSALASGVQDPLKIDANSVQKV